MAQTIHTTTPDTLTSGAGLDLTDQNIMTLAGVAAGAVTLGGGAFVAAAVAPGHILSGSIVTAGLLTGGHLKKTTGSYLPFLGNKKDETPVVEATTVTA